MRAARSVMDRHPELADHISVSLHCELADILNAYTTLVEREGKLTGLHAYSAARPPHSEGLAVWIASYLANETELHEHQPAASELAQGNRRGVDDAAGLSAHPRSAAKSPSGIFCSTPTAHAPCTPRSIRRFARARTWRRCGRPCSTARSTGSSATTPAARPSRNGRRTTPNNIWLAKSGFGGTEYLLSGVLSEGSKRGLSYNRMAELLSWTSVAAVRPAQQGRYRPGLRRRRRSRRSARGLHRARRRVRKSEQGYSPFEGQELTGRVKSTFLRGALIYHQGDVVGAPRGRYLHRPIQ